MWDKVSVGFDAEEETANFGTRACAVNDVAVYETNTLAAILSGDEKPKQLPKVQSLFIPQVGLCVVIDSSLTLFNEDCSSVKCKITVQQNIDVFTFTPCGLFVLIGLSGEIKCFCIATGCEVFSRTVCSNLGMHNIAVLDCFKEENNTYIVSVLNSGQVLKSSGVVFSEINEADLKTNDEDKSINYETLKFNEVYHLKGMQSQICSGSSLFKEQDTVLLGSTENICKLYLDYFDTSFCEIIGAYKIVKIGGVVNDSVLFALCDNGSILQVCLHTMCPFFLWNDFLIKDFVVFEGNTTNECNLLVLVDEPLKGYQATAHLVLLTWPEFKISYKLPVADISYLINQQGSEEILFLEGFGNGVIDTVRVKAIVESQPDLRLQRILRRCKFEEAEKFARAFRLDLEIVYKAHVQRLCQDLSPWSNPLDSQKKIFNKILELIEKIKDDHFVAEVCASAIPPDFDMLHTMLTYGMERFSKVADKEGTNLSELLEKVSTIARRLDTCMLISGSATTVTHWIEFPKHDLAISCLNHIQRDEINESILIWSRHLSDMKPLFTMDKAKNLLTAIPKGTKLSDLTLWLHHFVPPILSFFPNILSDIIQWTVQRTRHLEILDISTWPDSGLTLATCLFRLVHTPHTERSVLLQSQKVGLRNENLSHQSPLNQLLKLIDVLQDINQLKKDFGVIIPFDKFVQDDHSSFVAALLERLPLEKISSFIPNLFHRLLEDRGLDSDTLILQFIQDIVMNCEDWWFWDEAPWEARVSALIPHINNIQFKLDAILHVLTSAPVPWTSTVSQLADLGVHLPHYKTNDVRSECNNVPKRLLMKKYGTLIDNKHEMQLVRLILKKKQKSMLDDIEALAKCVKGDATDIYLTVIIHLIENAEESKVLTILETLDEMSREQCLSRLILHIQNLLKHNNWKKIPAYFQSLPQLENPKEKEFLSELKSIYKLKIEFDITVSYSTMSLRTEKHSILESYAERISEDIISGSLTEQMAVEKIHRLSYLIRLSREEAIATLSSVCVKNSLHQALVFTSKIEDLEKKPAEAYKKVSKLIAQLIAEYKPADSHGTLIDLLTTTMTKISKQYLTFSPDCHVIEISQWINLLSQNGFGNETKYKSLQNTVYGDPVPTSATAVLVHCSMKHMIVSFVYACRSAETNLNCSTRGVLSHIPDIAVENRELTTTWQRLKEEQQDLTCIRLICEYCWAQKITSVSIQENASIDKFLTQCIKNLLRKLFRLHKFDLELALSLLSFFTVDDALGFLVEEAQSVGYNYQRLSCMSELALTFSSLNKIDKYTKSFRKYHTSCKWAKKLNELGLPYKDAFKDSDTEHKQLLLKLITMTSTTLPLLKEFCTDMLFDKQECFMIYLEYLLLNWVPELDISVDPSTGERAMVLKNSCKELLQQCKAILCHLGTKPTKPEAVTMKWSESIQNDLCKIWEKVNYYYYEVYFVLTDLYQRALAKQSTVTQMAVQYQTLLNFLQTYKRISSPSEDEQENWFREFPNTNNLPPIASFRLPFYPFFKKDSLWGFLKPELSLKTYSRWFNIIQSLNLDRDMLCTLTIQRLTSEELAGEKKDKSSWQLQPCNSGVLQEIEECVMNIRRQEMKSAALYYVVNHMPPGADQMAAATMCFHQAEQWVAQDSSDSARAGFAKVQKKFLTVSTSHILYSSGLNKADYLRLVLHPQELICALYNDPSILLRKAGKINHCADINGVVSKIGSLHKVNVLAIKQELLSEWLYPPDNQAFDMSCDDITQNIVAIQNNSPLAAMDNDNIVRACYVLQSMDMETAARYLVSYAGLRDETECRPTSVRLRALQSLCSIATPDIVLNTTGQTLENIKGSIQNLMFINELEKLGIVWSTTGFETCDKSDIVRILLMKGNPHAVQLAAAMGYVFKLTKTCYWDQILQLMTSFSMIEELVIILPELTGLCHLLNSTIFNEAWNCSLITPFQKAEYPLSDECSYRVHRALEMLYCCPIPRQINLSLMLQHCKRLHCNELVSRLQPFLSLTQSTEQLKYPNNDTHQ